MQTSMMWQAAFLKNTLVRLLPNRVTKTRNNIAWKRTRLLFMSMQGFCSSTISHRAHIKNFITEDCSTLFVLLKIKQEVRHFSNRMEPKHVEITNVEKSVASFLNPYNDQCHAQNKFLNVFYVGLQTLEVTFTGRYKIKDSTFLPSFRLDEQDETKLKPMAQV